jgi:hypothetical protein
MARYYFNLVNHITVPDTYSEDFGTLNEAKWAASQAAQDIVLTKQLDEVRGFFVAISDKRGKELFRTPLSHPGALSMSGTRH